MQGSGRKYLLAGLFTLAFGALVVWQSTAYTIGTPARMGPGFFPTALGALLVLVGVGIVFQALRSDEVLERIRLRPLLVISGAVAIFALAVDRAGLIVSAFAVVLVAGFAERSPKKPALVALAVVLTAATYVVFVAILGMRIRLLPWGP
jgi:hypothetical protein